MEQPGPATRQLFSTLDCLAALAPPTPKLLRLDPPTWGAPAARVRERPDSLCQAALETRNEGETLSLRQLGCASAPRTHVEAHTCNETERAHNEIDFTCQEAHNETERRLNPSHGTSPPSIFIFCVRIWSAITTLPSSTVDPNGSPADRHGGRPSHLHARDTGRSPTAFKVQAPAWCRG